MKEIDVWRITRVMDWGVQRGSGKLVPKDLRFSLHIHSQLQLQPRRDRFFRPVLREISDQIERKQRESGTTAGGVRTEASNPVRYVHDVSSTLDQRPCGWPALVLLDTYGNGTGTLREVLATNYGQVVTPITEAISRDDRPMK